MSDRVRYGEEKVSNCDVLSVVFMSTNTNRLLHQLCRVTLIIWDWRGLFPNSFKRETCERERDVASPFAIHGTGTRRFVEV